MVNLKTHRRGIVAAALFFGFMLCHNGVAEQKLMAISMCDLDTARAVAVTSDIMSKAEAAGYRVIIRDAQHMLSQQVTDITELIEEAPDCLIVSAVKSIGLKTVLHHAAEKGVRVIMVDRFVADVPPEDILCSIGMDATWAGAACAQALAEYFHGQAARILEVQGEAGASSSNGFALGFRNTLCQYPNLQIAGVTYGAFDRVTAKRAIQTYGVSNPESFDAIFGHSDEDGIGAVEAYLSTAVAMPIISIGGQDDARRALEAGRLWACLQVTPNFGDQVLAVLDAEAEGRPFQQTRLFQGTIYTQDNVSEMRGY